MILDFTKIEERTKRGRPKAERKEHDAYMTPTALSDAIVSEIHRSFPTARTILEPACGDGEFVAAIRQSWPEALCVGIDIREECRAKIEALGASFLAGDFLRTPPIVGADLVIGNPPFVLFTEFIGHALDGMQPGAILAFVSRLGHLVGSRESQSWWITPRGNGLSPNRQIVADRPIHPRPSFTNGTSTDSQEYGLLVMRSGFDNGGQFDPIKWNKPATKRGRKPKITE